MKTSKNNKIIGSLKSYHILPALFAAILLAVTGGLVGDWLDSYSNSTLDAFGMSNGLETHAMKWLLSVLLFTLSCAAYLLLYIRPKRYRAVTGRNYWRDRKDYHRSYSDLVRYFRDADPNRLDISSFPETDWRHTEGVILGQSDGHTIVRPSGLPWNLALFALPGSGKTTCQIIPTALRFGGSILAIDIKGDIIKRTADFRKIKIFSPADPEKSCHFDPFYGLANMTEEKRVIYIETMGSMLVPDEGGKDSKYFTDGGRDYWCGIALYLLDQDINITLSEIIRKILTGNAVDWTIIIRESSCETAKAYVASYYGTNETNVAGCYNTLCRNLRKFSTSGIAKLFDAQGDCISPEILEAGFDIYLEIPQQDSYVYASAMTVIIQNFMNYFFQRPDMSTGEKIRPILFLLDEFPQLTFAREALHEGLSTLRSRQVSFFLSSQSIAQITDKYGDNSFRSIIDTCNIISVMSAQDPRSREYFTDLFGSRKVLNISTTDSGSGGRTVSESRESVLRPEEFANLGKDVAIYYGGKYVRAQKTYCGDPG